MIKNANEIWPTKCSRQNYFVLIFSKKKKFNFNHLKIRKSRRKEKNKQFRLVFLSFFLSFFFF